MKCVCGLELNSEVEICSGCGKFAPDQDKSVMTDEELEPYTHYFSDHHVDQCAASRRREAAVATALEIARDAVANKGDRELAKKALSRATCLLSVSERLDEFNTRMFDLAKIWIELLQDKERARQAIFEAATYTYWHAYSNFHAALELLGEDDALSALEISRCGCRENNQGDDVAGESECVDLALSLSPGLQGRNTFIRESLVRICRMVEDERHDDEFEPDADMLLALAESTLGEVAGKEVTEELLRVTELLLSELTVVDEDGRIARQVDNERIAKIRKTLKDV